MFTPNKKLGQNFLKNKQVILKMIAGLEMSEGETLIEVGPGLGALTIEIDNQYGNVDIKIFAVEIDVRFVDKLESMFLDTRNLMVVEKNILDYLPSFDTKGRVLKILGTLPFYITSPIIHAIINMKQQPKICVLLIQKEVAKKISAEAPKSSYLSTFVQTFYEVKYLGDVDRNDFSPSPKVDGGILKLKKRKNVNIEDISKYEGFLHLVYSNPRKMLNKVFKQDELNRASINGKQRAQNYDWEKWAKAFTILR